MTKLQPGEAIDVGASANVPRISRSENADGLRVSAR